MHFVQQLLFDGAGVHRAAGAGGLADNEFAVRMDFGDGESRRVHVGHLFQARHAEIAARDLQSAFQHVARHGGAAQAGPVSRIPAKVRHCRSQCQGGVRHAACHDDLRAGGQGLRDFRRTQIGRGANHLLSFQRRAQAFLQQGALRRRIQGVAMHHRDLRHGQPLLARDCGNAPGCRGRVCGAEIADDVDAMA
ncbi:hypothetical protein G6F57_018603 [Rhizopus arrhizus]|nr:hypothetical protein G6F57_018603 [Rhizopus arrhizus]